MIPHISVILTNYNYGLYLTSAIDSILNQTYTDFELIIVDDGSTDESATIINNYHDPRMRVFYIPHTGFANAKNIGLDNAVGDYIAFIDADDIAHPKWLEILELLSRTGAEISAINWNNFQHIPPQFTSTIPSFEIKIYQKMKMISMWKCPVGSFMWNKLYHKKLFHNLRHQNVPCLSDRIISVDLFQNANFVASTQIPVFFHRIHTGSMTTYVHIQDWYWQYRINIITDCIIRSINIDPLSKYVCKQALIALYAEASKHIDLTVEKEKMAWLLNDTTLLPITI